MFLHSTFIILLLFYFFERGLIENMIQELPQKCFYFLESLLKYPDGTKCQAESYIYKWKNGHNYNSWKCQWKLFLQRYIFFKIIYQSVFNQLSISVFYLFFAKLILPWVAFLLWFMFLFIWPYCQFNLLMKYLTAKTKCSPNLPLFSNKLDLVHSFNFFFCHS